MELPFSHEAFLDLFGAFNSALWPAVIALWAATVLLVALWIRQGDVARRTLFTLLAVHWAWSAIAYHWAFFRTINPAAALFAALFIAEAVLFIWLARRAEGRIETRLNFRSALAGALVLYGLLYPVIGLGFGLRYPRLPLFAVPCPTTIVTAGLLLVATGAPRVIKIVPILWAVVGTSGAFLLGIRADLALIPAGALLALDLFAPSALGPRPADPPHSGPC